LIQGFLLLKYEKNEKLQLGKPIFVVKFKHMSKQGFSERMYLRYLRTKFRTIGTLSPAIAGKLAFNLFCTPYPKYKKTKAPAIFHQAKKIQIKVSGDITIKGYEWQATKPNGKTVLICHGYASYFYKFDQYVQPLLKQGFRVIGFDAPAHGQSEGKYINVIVYKDAIEHIIRVCGPIDHFMGHSLGGITLAMIAETISNPKEHKFVLIAPATKTTTTFESYFNMMHFSEAVREGFLNELGKQTNLPVSYFEADRAIEKYKGEILWVHDQGDRVCPYQDLVNFKNNAPENIKFLITNGLGHNKVYKTPDIIDKIVAFLSA
jgi:pimeloyl-ACP methyl ester carboxylesterase